MRGPSLSRWYWALFLALVALGFLACGLLWGQAPPTVTAQTESLPEPTPLQETLLQANEALTLLVPLLKTQETLIASLQTDLAKLDGQWQISEDSLLRLTAQLATSEASFQTLAGQLDDSQKAQEASAAALQKAQGSLELLSTQYDALSASWEAYHKEIGLQLAILRSQRTFWQVATGIAGLGAVIALMAFLVK